jgi:hypothetical protein
MTEVSGVAAVIVLGRAFWRATCPIQGMISNYIDLQEPAATNSDSENDSEFRICKANYVGIVRPDEFQYEFLVRDLRRESPTIYGSGIDLAHATAAVTQLLDSLIAES